MSNDTDMPMFHSEPNPPHMLAAQMAAIAMSKANKTTLHNGKCEEEYARLEAKAVAALMLDEALVLRAVEELKADARVAERARQELEKEAEDARRAEEDARLAQLQFPSEIVDQSHDTPPADALDATGETPIIGGSDEAIPKHDTLPSASDEPAKEGA